MSERRNRLDGAKVVADGHETRVGVSDVHPASLARHGGELHLVDGDVNVKAGRADIDDFSSQVEEIAAHHRRGELDFLERDRGDTRRFMLFQQILALAVRIAWLEQRSCPVPAEDMAGGGLGGASVGEREEVAGSDAFGPSERRRGVVFADDVGERGTRDGDAADWEVGVGSGDFEEGLR